MPEIQTNIVNSVTEFTYAKNCHYMKLRDKSGNETVLLEHGVIRFVCDSCSFKFFSASNPGKIKCPVCSEGLVGQWTRPQIALIPEDESDFKMP